MEQVEEKVILKNLVLNEDYFKKAFPFLQEEMFSEAPEKRVFKYLSGYAKQYGKRPNPDILSVLEERDKKGTAFEHKAVRDIIAFFKDGECTSDLEWLCKATESWIQRQLYYNALFEAAEEFKDKGPNPQIPEKLQKAFSVSVDANIGMAFDDAEARWEMYNEDESRIPFLVDSLNYITKGGLTKKTLNCLMSSNTGGFKSGSMCSFACDYIRQGYNCLYLSFEMSEDKVLERIDANMLDIAIDDVKRLKKDDYVSRISELVKKTQGRLIVKQYPTSQCNVGHIRYLLDDLKNKKGFVPDVVFFDYLGIMSSLRYKGDSKTPDHLVLKAISEEVRGLCVEKDIVGWTAMQSNRSGMSEGEGLNLDSISASFAVAYGCDLILGLISSPQEDQEGRIICKQLKNRYFDINSKPLFRLSINKEKMRLKDYVNPTTGEGDLEMPVSEVAARDSDDAERSVFTAAMSRNRRRKKIDTSKFKF